MGFSFLPLTLLILFTIAATSTAQTSPGFKCTSNITCHALIDYTLPNTTSLSSIQTLFQVKNFRTLLGANSFPPSTLPTNNLTASQTIKIPFPCLCSNGKGISYRRPNYTVQTGDDLDHIAVDIFSRLVSYQEIAAVNGIPNPDQIPAGKTLWIPLPCSCDEVEGSRVVHYGYVVPGGSTVAGIASKFNVSESILAELNGNVSDSTLKAQQVLDVPLKVCTSAVRQDSLDYPLLVSNGSYVYTANNCVKCTCDAANNWTLKCEPSQVKPSNASNWTTCPTTQCAAASSLYLSNTTTSGCNTTTCAYAGYSNQTIFTELSTLSTCPVSGNNARKMGSQGVCWSLLFTFTLHLTLFSGFFLS